MRVLALDIGESRIGLALSDPLGISVQSLPTVKRQNLETDLEKIVQLVKEKGVDEVVIGLPLNLKGQDTKQTEIVRNFHDLLALKLSCKVNYWDERFTTKIATERLIADKRQPSRKKGMIDQVAAMIILQDYLASRRFRNV